MSSKTTMGPLLKVARQSVGLKVKGQQAVNHLTYFTITQMGVSNSTANYVM